MDNDWEKLINYCLNDDVQQYLSKKYCDSEGDFWISVDDPGFPMEKKKGDDFLQRINWFCKTLIYLSPDVTFSVLKKLQKDHNSFVEPIINQLEDIMATKNLKQPVASIITIPSITINDHQHNTGYLEKIKLAKNMSAKIKEIQKTQTGPQKDDLHLSYIGETVDFADKVSFWEDIAVKALTVQSCLITIQSSSNKMPNRKKGSLNAKEIASLVTLGGGIETFCRNIGVDISNPSSDTINASTFFSTVAENVDPVKCESFFEAIIYFHRKEKVYDYILSDQYIKNLNSTQEGSDHLVDAVTKYVSSLLRSESVGIKKALRNEIINFAARKQTLDVQKLIDEGKNASLAAERIPE